MNWIKLLSLFFILGVSEMPLQSQDGFLVSVQSSWWSKDNAEIQNHTREKLDAIMLDKLRHQFVLWRFETSETLKNAANKTLSDSLTFTVDVRAHYQKIEDVTVLLEWRRGSVRKGGDWPIPKLLTDPLAITIPRRDGWITLLTPVFDKLVAGYETLTNFKSELQNVAISRSAEFPADLKNRPLGPYGTLPFTLTDDALQFFNAQIFEISGRVPGPQPLPVKIDAEGTLQLFQPTRKNMLKVCRTAELTELRDITQVKPELVMWRGEGKCTTRPQVQ